MSAISTRVGGDVPHEAHSPRSNTASMICVHSFRITALCAHAIGVSPRTEATARVWAASSIEVHIGSPWPWGAGDLLEKYWGPSRY